jgi:uncharacterized membrane protein
LQQLDSALRTSFANLKRDVLKQDQTIEQLSVKFTEQENFIKHLAAEIAILRPNQTSKPESTPTPVTKESTNIQPQSRPRLTPLQLQLLKHLMILQLEAGRRYVSMRELAAELYPDKVYSNIKTTLSKYLKELGQEGLIDKLNNGRLLVSFTETALQYADDARLKRMKDLISQPQER